VTVLTVDVHLLKVDVGGGVGRLCIEDPDVLCQSNSGCWDREKRGRDGHSELHCGALHCGALHWRGACAKYLVSWPSGGQVRAALRWGRAAAACGQPSQALTVV
jgi:hypothetical protein